VGAVGRGGLWDGTLSIILISARRAGRRVLFIAHLQASPAHRAKKPPPRKRAAMLPPSACHGRARARLELVDLLVDEVVDLGVQAGGETLLAGELVEGRVDQGVLGLVIAAVGVVGVVVAVLAALAGGVTLELFEIVLETHRARREVVMWERGRF